MNKRQVSGLVGRFAGAAIGALIVATPAYIIHEENTGLVTDLKCYEEPTRYIGHEECKLMEQAFETTLDLSIYFSALGGGLFGWRRGRKTAENIMKEGQSASPEPRSDI